MNLIDFNSSLIKGAKQAGLDPKYIEKLAQQPTYKASQAVLTARQERPNPEDLPEISFEELAKHPNRVKITFHAMKPQLNNVVFTGCLFGICL